MPSTYLGLADLTKLNDQNISDIDVDDLLLDAPLLAAMAAVPASNGDVHKYLKKTGSPVVGFRDPNTGRDQDASSQTLVTQTLKLLDASFTIDKALGSIMTGGREALIAMELEAHLRAAFAKLEKQIIYGTVAGTDGDTTGFTALGNLRQLLPDSLIIDAGATTNLTSVWLIRSRPDEIAVIAGHDGNIEVGDPQEQRVDDGTGKYYHANVVGVHGWYGLQYGSNISNTVRIANLGATANTLDDDQIFEGLSLFPSQRQPNMIVMNRRSLEQLRKSRTATNATGAPAPVPTEVAGIPIIVTDHIENDEVRVTV